jgi:hypothetical protein
MVCSASSTPIVAVITSARPKRASRCPRGGDAGRADAQPTRDQPLSGLFAAATPGRRRSRHKLALRNADDENGAMRSVFHSTWQSVKSFLSNPAYATWVQSVFLAITVVAAFLTIKENHHDNAVNNVNQAVQRYYSGSPTLFSYTNDLFVAQSALVQEAKKK